MAPDGDKRRCISECVEELIRCNPQSDSAPAKMEPIADYAQSAWKVESIGHGDNVSKTCCRLHDEPDSHKNPRPLNDTLCQSAAADNPYRHSRGCLGALEELVKRESVLLIAVGCGVAALEMVGIALSVYVCKET
ncbi:hypothetical protein HPB50_015022 [Hyalomma asiaticum]|uniref:Uncharacterized protein n=1 Tax=Hyalomma asiaticum TaxID=266040 RepID=A0ACB7SNP4_HYAAI|nr:hypothetical protein HPB50_015022 [Hyalomma asiaticum]